MFLLRAFAGKFLPFDFVQVTTPTETPMPLLVKCPTCRKEVQWEDNPHRPFCSDRCQLIDLGAWTEERYKIPGDDADAISQSEDDDEEAR